MNLNRNDETKGTSVQRIRERDLTYAIVLRVPFAQAEDVEAQIENLFSQLIVYQHWDTGRLYISKRPPEGVRE